MLNTSMHGAYHLMLVTPLYVLLSYAATQNAIHNPTHHDIVYLYSEYAVYAIPAVLLGAMILGACTKPKYDLLMKRIALMAVLKGIAQFITITPQPGSMEECENEPIWKLKACADMMFSGHTCFVYLVLYKFKYRMSVVFTMAFQLVMADWHFMADCFMAVIAGFAIEHRIKDESYL